MNFSLIGPGDREYKKQLMKQHMERTRKKTDVYTEVSECSPTIKNDCMRLSNYESAKSSPPRKKTVNEQNEKMKKYYRDQIEESLFEMQKRKVQEKQQERQCRIYMARENGVLDYLEKEIEKRDNFIKGCWEKQDKMNNYYIDDSMIKHRRAMQHINLNYDADVFNHECDKYQEKQKMNQSLVCDTNMFLRKIQQADKDIERNNYGKYLDEKCEKTRHNPITNPMEYHIENPYLRARISKY